MSKDEAWLKLVGHLRGSDLYEIEGASGARAVLRLRASLPDEVSPVLNIQLARMKGPGREMADWVRIEVILGRYEAADLPRMIAHTERFLLGAIAGTEEFVTLRHSASMSGITPGWLDIVIHQIAYAADELKTEYVSPLERGFVWSSPERDGSSPISGSEQEQRSRPASWESAVDALRKQSGRG